MLKKMVIPGERIAGGSEDTDDTDTAWRKSCCKTLMMVSSGLFVLSTEPKTSKIGSVQFVPSTTVLIICKLFM